MFIENRIKGIFVWTLSIIYLVLLSVKLVIDLSSLSMQVIILYTAINILLVLIGFYIIRQKYPVKMWLNSTIIIFGLFLSTIIIYSSNGVKGPYFPFLYLILLIFAAFSRGKLLLYLTGAISLSIVLFWVCLSPDKVSPFMKQDYILYLTVLFVTIISIRNYPLECLSCDLDYKGNLQIDCETCAVEPIECSNKKNCTVMNYNKLNEG